MEINVKEIADWVNDCPTHKIEVLYSDENGIQLLVNFNNEKDEKRQAPSSKRQASSNKLDK